MPMTDTQYTGLLLGEIDKALDVLRRNFRLLNAEDEAAEKIYELDELAMAIGKG